ncbi:MAG: PAS domain S-box protein [Bacteroidota bacterium]|nr:PAS domain S-box protein [Bacteroidota bacterium]
MSLRSSTKNIPMAERFSLYKEVLDSLPLAVYLCDADGYVTAYNEAAAVLWGRHPQIGKDLWCGSWKILNPDGSPLPPAECPMALALKGQEPVIGREIIIEQPNGKRFNILPHPRPLFDEEGVLAGAINMLVDVSQESRLVTLELRTKELGRIAEALRRSEERYNRMISEIEDYAIIRLSKDGIIENWNKGAEKIKGYSESEIVGKSFRLFYPSEDQASGLPEKLLELARKNGKANHEGWRVKKDGTRFWGSITMTAFHDRRGNVAGFSKVTRDLTERRNQDLRIAQINDDLRMKNELLRQSEERYQRMVTEVEDYVIILLDVKGLILNWNKGAEKIKGYSAQEIIGKHFSIFYSEEDRRNGVADKVLHEAAVHGKALHEGWRLRKDGSTFWGSVVMTALHNESGGLIGFTKVTRDLTEKKVAEDRLRSTSLILEEKNRELERINEELSSFAYVSSHDLQEPLRKIQTFSDRILDIEYNNLSEKGKDYFRRMQGGAARMQKLIRDILAYSRTTTSEKKLEKTDLTELLAQAKIELEVSIIEKKAVIESDRLPTLNIIPFQMQQLFTNLLNNALKFSKPDEPPHIKITCEAVDGRKVNTGQLAPKEYYHIAIKDNGIGFEPQYNKKIFEVFQRLHGRSDYGGTGIGLAICKKIVENHNGIISAEGLLGEGATFHIYLPRFPDRGSV